MKRKSLEDAQCPVARTLDVLGDWWSLLIIRDAFDGISRFSEFQRIWGWQRIFFPLGYARWSPRDFAS